MTGTLRVHAYGVAVPKGSKKLVTHGKGGRVLRFPLLVESNAHAVEKWEKTLAGAALVALGEAPRPMFGEHVPLEVSLEVRIARPKSVKRSHPSVKPDADKLARPLDVLTGLVWADDGQIVDLRVVKRYCAPGEVPGAVIEVRAIGPFQATMAIEGS